MRSLSSYKGEEALDVLADLIDPITEILSDPKNRVGKFTKENRMDIISNCIKNHKKAVLQILARLEGVPVDKYECTIFSLPSALLQILNDEELADFFISQGWGAVAVNSGSVTGSTKGKKQ